MVLLNALDLPILFIIQWSSVFLDITPLLIPRQGESGSWMHVVGSHMTSAMWQGRAHLNLLWLKWTSLCCWVRLCCCVQGEAGGISSLCMHISSTFSIPPQQNSWQLYRVFFFLMQWVRLPNSPKGPGICVEDNSKLPFLKGPLTRFLAKHEYVPRGRR